MTPSLKTKIFSRLLCSFPSTQFAETVEEKIDEAVTVMSLNTYGWKTMPVHMLKLF